MKLTELKIIFSKVAVSKTATFLKLRYLFLYRYFVLEIRINFYGLVKAAYGGKSFEIGFKFNSFDNNWTHQIHFEYFFWVMR